MKFYGSVDLIDIMKTFRFMGRLVEVTDFKNDLVVNWFAKLIISEMIIGE